MEEKYKEFLREIEGLGYTDLGRANGWKNDPSQKEACKILGHDGIPGNPHKFGATKNQRGRENLAGCHTCQYYYKYDCSD